jgi:hypothetical protein
MGLPAAFCSQAYLTRRLYVKGWAKVQRLNLYRFIDYVMALSEPFELKYMQAVEQLEEEKKMPYITSAERIGIKKGLEKGLEQGLEQGEKIVLLRLLHRKFGTIPEHYRTQVEQANAATLLIWAENLIEAHSVEEIFKDRVEI